MRGCSTRWRPAGPRSATRATWRRSAGRPTRIARVPRTWRPWPTGRGRWPRWLRGGRHRARARRRLHGRARHRRGVARPGGEARAGLPRPPCRSQRPFQRRRRRLGLDGGRAPARRRRSRERARRHRVLAAAARRRPARLPRHQARHRMGAGDDRAAWSRGRRRRRPRRGPRAGRLAARSARSRDATPSPCTSTSTSCTSSTRRSPRTPTARGSRSRSPRPPCAVLTADPRFRALTVTELNPFHGAADGSTTRRLVEVLARALS